MDCVACRMAAFCSLEEALDLYGLSRADVAEEVVQVIDHIYSPNQMN